MLLVFGSINLDLSFRTPQLPLAGETVLGGSLLISPGGKGANQAHAAALAGAPTCLVGAVGDDVLADAALPLLCSAGVDLTHLQRLPGRTGCASIAVDDAGQNQIIVAPGVNLSLRQDVVSDALLADCKAVLLQMETDPAHNLALLQRARRQGCRTLLNNAPARPLSHEWLAAVDVLVVNEIELTATAASLGLTPEATDLTDPAALLRAVAGQGSTTVVLTRGAQGAMTWHAGAIIHTPALAVPVIDTTGAGDTFCGVLAASLVQGLDMVGALKRAGLAASLACTKAGAQAAQPTRSEIDQAEVDNRATPIDT